MRSTRDKGRAFESWCKKFLEADGWAVHLCGRKAKMIGPGRMITVGDDIFGCDLVAIRSGFMTLFVQTTLDSGVAKRLNKFLAYPWNLNHQLVELWQKKPGGEVVVQRFTGSRLHEMERIIRGKRYRADVSLPAQPDGEEV